MLRKVIITRMEVIFHVVLCNGVNAGSIGNSDSRRYHLFLCCTSKKTEKIDSSTSRMIPNSKNPYWQWGIG